VPEMVELENQRVGLAAGAPALAEQLDQIGGSLLDQGLFALYGARDVALAVPCVVRAFVVRSAGPAVVVALPARLAAPGEIGARLAPPAASADPRWPRCIRHEHMFPYRPDVGQRVLAFAAKALA
jgi:hypothetical protein